MEYEFLNMSEDAMKADAQKFANGLKERECRSVNSYQPNTGLMDCLQIDEDDAIENAQKFAEGLKDRGYQMDNTYQEVVKHRLANLQSQGDDE